MKRSAALVNKFTKRYNIWKKQTSALGKYAKRSSFTDKTSSGLEDMIKAFFKMRGIKCWKIDVKGTPRIVNGRPVFTHTACDKGVADLFTIVEGKYLAIEVKIGKDRQSEKQKEFEKDINKQGGSYIIVKNFADFIHRYADWYQSKFNTLK